MPSILYSCFPVLFPSWLKGAVRGKVVCVRACVRERASVCMRVCVRINKMALVFCLNCNRSG